LIGKESVTEVKRNILEKLKTKWNKKKVVRVVMINTML